MSYIAKTSIKVRPELVDPEIYGHHKSIVSGGLRTWSFEEEKGRDKFIKGINEGKFFREKED